MTTCDHVQDRLPEFLGGRLDDAGRARVQSHLEGCADCDAALEVVQLLAAVPPRPVPAGLEARLQAAVRAEVIGRPVGAETPAVRRGWRTPQWALAAAAGLALAVATPVLMERMGPVGGSDVAIDEAEVTAMLTETLPSPWFGDEGTVAGAPVLDDLSDDALLQLLEEMD
ncbi:anti-sigma factor [Gaopeijia maritima]|uniref:Anti-sigma factor n=1 Tax=Gaopeijia maritima TaxID=3119007 RepID=A0ABU9EAJ0_9BACT